MSDQLFFSKMCVWSVYVLFHICIKTHSVDFEEFGSFSDFCAELVGDRLTFVFSPDEILLRLTGLKAPTN